MLKITKDINGTLRQHINVNGHTLYSDIGTSFGGNDSAADPHDLYDSALASCKALTLLLFAKRKQIPLESVKLTIERDNSQENSGVYQLHVQMRLDGDLTEAQRQQLLDISEKCPIHKLMTRSETVISTELVR
jgi:putative redox protein